MNRDEIIEILSAGGAGWGAAEADERLFERARQARNETIGDAVYLRGLIEYSNVCAKDCYYCGIRNSSQCDRYTLETNQIIGAAEYAKKNGYGSVVLQGGENTASTHIDRITRLVEQIAAMDLGITLSMGEQSQQTYRRWRQAGANRYLLRIEASNRALYELIHPADHSYSKRVEALQSLKSEGYQVGTGVMVGLPFQTVEDLADDLLFMQKIDIDMCGMGPYIVAEGTPLAVHESELKPEESRLQMTLRMIAALRLLMPKINIASSTALQAIDPDGRLRAIDAGANVVMPNLTPSDAKTRYLLYNNKPMELDTRILERNIHYGERGDSAHFRDKMNKRM